MNQAAFDFTARNTAIDRVESNANSDWMSAAVAVIERICRDCGAGYEFTTDGLDGLLATAGVSTHEGRAWGAVMRGAARRGLIEPTGRYKKSTSSKCHNRPKMIWIVL